jgi:hypothetical protein
MLEEGTTVISKRGLGLGYVTDERQGPYLIVKWKLGPVTNELPHDLATECPTCGGHPTRAVENWTDCSDVFHHA